MDRVTSGARNYKFVLPPTAPLRYKTANFNSSTTILEVLNKLTDLCHFVNFAECGYGLYLPKTAMSASPSRASTRGVWLENDKRLADYTLTPEECSSLELRKRPGFRSNPNMQQTASTALPVKEGNALRYSPLTKLWTPCILRLYNTKLAMCSSEHDNNPDVLLFANVTKVEKEDKKYAFFIAIEDTKTTFRCRNNAEMLEWVKVICETVSSVNPDFTFDVSPYLPPPQSILRSPRSPRGSFLNLLMRDEPITVTNSSTSNEVTISSSATSSGQGQGLTRGLSVREERKKYSFLTLRNNKKTPKEKETTLLNLRKSGETKSQRDILKETKEREEKKEREERKMEKMASKRKTSNTISAVNPAAALSSSNLVPPVTSAADFPFEEEVGIRARSHSTSTTTIPLIPTIQSLLTAKRLSTNEAEIQSLREKLQFQTEHNRQIEERYQKLLLKYTDANKSYHKLPSPRGDQSTSPRGDLTSSRAEQPTSPLATSISAPSPLSSTTTTQQEPEQQHPPPMRKSSSLWRFSKKSVDTEVLELKLELQNLKAENRVLKLQLDRRADRDLKSSGSGKDRKRSSPTRRKQLREGIEREKSIGRLDKEGRRSRQLSISSSTSENDLSGLDFQSPRSRSASTQSEAGEDIFLRDSIRNDYSRDSLSPSREGSRTDLTALRDSRDSRADYHPIKDLRESSQISGDVVRSKSEGEDSIETLQKEMLVLHDKILEQQQMLRREEGTRLDIEKDFRRVKEYDETSLMDMESITRRLQQNLTDLKMQLEIEFTDGIEFSDEES